MTGLPPRSKAPLFTKNTKPGATPLQILLQMGFPKHRALKALGATGHRSVQLASDWLLTHVNDISLDTDEPREYIFYASPTGTLLSQLLEFWEKSKTTSGWNGAHNYSPHVTLVSFFKAPDETALQLAKAVKQAVEGVGDPPTCPLRLEPYVSHNFMGLFVSEEHADYLKRIAVQYVKLVSSPSMHVEPQLKSLHITLAYHFEMEAYERLKDLVDDMQPLDNSYFELRLYSRDPRFIRHQVYKVTQSYTPKASDEIELVVGDYIYIEQKEFDNTSDGWVYGTSWLTGVSGFLPGVYTKRTAESDAWTLHRAISLNNYKYSHHSHWDYDDEDDDDDDDDDDYDTDYKSKGTNTKDIKYTKDRRYIFTMRHGERVDLTYGHWTSHCFDAKDNYSRMDLNMPLTLPKRFGGRLAYSKDCPLTRVGRLQAYLVGEGLRLAKINVKHVYASAALRCVETAQEFLEGHRAHDTVKIKVEPGLFEYKMWHESKGLAPFMTPKEFYLGGYNVDINYKPYVDLNVATPETMQDFYDRCALVMQSAYKDTQKVGGNILYVGHASSLDLMVLSLKRLGKDMENRTRATYIVNHHVVRVPYCSLGAMLDKPFQVVPPPCPPHVNTSSRRFDWKVLLDSEF
ncbi:protein UBASH3A homolog isoform X3 [Hyposmocoma kahamanoa]|uniref:protein UBASH3A homolog isoform X3 n=1 Tax=Hyposmocoma kahamanoa TaxID=1477025 RepID=UPI000E6D9175|nr:protein UBASH3A homolog isoform X3 [Hyposmocoma kahamanoa]